MLICLIRACCLENVVLSVDEDVEARKNVLGVENALDLEFSFGRQLCAINMSVLVLGLSKLVFVHFSRHCCVVFEQGGENLLNDPIFDSAIWELA